MRRQTKTPPPAGPPQSDRAGTRGVPLAVSFALIVALIMLVVMTLGSLGGCAPIQDGLSRLVGLPTNKDINAIKAELAAKDRQVEELGSAADQAKRIADQADRAAADAAAQRASAQATAAAIARQMADAADDPVTFAALRKAFADANSMIERFGGLQASAQETAAKSRAEVAQRRSEADLLKKKITALEMRLEGVAADRAAVMAATGKSIDALGAQAQALGVPGAQAAAGRVAAVAGTLGGLIFGGPAGIGVFLERRRRRREVSEHKARADAAERVITVTQEEGLIVDDPARKAQAKSRLTRDEREALARGKAMARPRGVLASPPSAPDPASDRRAAAPAQ